MNSIIYFDQAATSFPKPPQVPEAVHKALTETSASPGRSGHQFSLHASRTIFEAREAMAELLGVDDSSRIVFTMNVTQALNTALSGLLSTGDHVLTSSLEHNSVMRPLHDLSERRGFEVEVVPIAPNGVPKPEDFKTRLRKNTRLVVVTQASNVIGTIFPIKEIRDALDGVPLLADAAQSAGALPLPPAEEWADMVAFTGHKGLMGPTGTGGLWVRPGLELAPLFTGGTGSRSEREEHPDFMPDSLEAGTLNTHGLAGLAAGIEFVMDVGPDRIREHELDLTRVFLDGLRRIRGAIVYGPEKAEDRVAVISMNLEGWSPSDLSGVLDREFGILTRPGLHCAPRAHRTIGTFPQGTVRFSMGWYNTREEVEKVLEVIEELSMYSSASSEKGR